MKKIILATVSFLTMLMVNAQDVEGIKIGQSKQKDKIVSIKGNTYQVMPVESDDSELCLGVMIMPVNNDTLVPTTLNKTQVDQFQSSMEEEFDVAFDSVLVYDEATMMFAKNKGVEYEINIEKSDDQYDAFFVIWYKELEENLKASTSVVHP
ncbi:hypothetical protein [Flammeovirga sp. SubArs3]|uniref:hypothetical protein n=1 Tax=Flammeovirga sp. SubArs3 TaxID=2995316 RepID=UPI00248BD1FA|nr:hypothetical protein [Flammeovirga sp. SubArs3]